MVIKKSKRLGAKSNMETAAEIQKDQDHWDRSKINESHSLLQKFGNSSRRTNMIKKHYKKVAKIQRSSSRDKTMAIIGISLGGNAKGKVSKFITVIILQ